MREVVELQWDHEAAVVEVNRLRAALANALANAEPEQTFNDLQAEFLRAQSKVDALATAIEVRRAAESDKLRLDAEQAQAEQSRRDHLMRQRFNLYRTYARRAALREEAARLRRHADALEQPGQLSLSPADMERITAELAEAGVELAEPADCDTVEDWARELTRWRRLSDRAARVPIDVPVI